MANMTAITSNNSGTAACTAAPLSPMFVDAPTFPEITLSVRGGNGPAPVAGVHIVMFPLQCKLLFLCDSSWSRPRRHWSMATSSPSHQLDHVRTSIVSVKVD